MSRIGKLPIPVPSGVDVTIDGRTVTVKGPKGTLTPHRRRADHASSATTTARSRSPARTTSGEPALHGLSRTLVNNMVVGVTARLREEAGDPASATASRSRAPTSSSRSASATRCRPGAGGHHVRGRDADPVLVSGIDKQQVGEIAANIRKLRKPDPYKGKGVRYEGEVIRRKVGKTGK